VDGSGRTDDILLVYGQSGIVKTIGPYDFDGQVAVVSRGIDDETHKLFMYGGTFLIDQKSGKKLVTNLFKKESFEAVYFYQSVVVYGNIRNRVNLYAPEAKYLILNGLPRPFTRSGEYITFDGE
jgi:hypothetical protein